MRSPIRKVLDEQDTGKSSDPVAMEPHTVDQVDRKDCKSLDSKASHPVCHNNSNSSLGVRFREMHIDSTKVAIPQIPMVIHDYKIRPRMKKDFNGYFIKML